MLRSISLLFLCINLNYSLRSWDQYSKMTEKEIVKHIASLVNKKEEETLSNCLAIHTFIKNIRKNEEFILSFREKKQTNVITRGFLNIKDAFLKEKLKK